jgi:type I restriction enzyme S subunit
MRSNYRKIGDYIQLVDERNNGHEVKNLLGLSISKQFIPSVANIIGTDMENYKIIRKNQFACSTMQVRRDKKMPVALLKEVDEAIISQAYPIFEVKDEKLLLPEYLMMWFTRTEFDREACFNAVGGVRGSLEWEDFCDMQLPIPFIEKQREIVAEYKVVQNRIALNNQLIQKLEQTAQAIYKQWFVDFEFPDENGNPYKCSGGEMEFNEELKKEIPKGWRVVSIKNFCKEMKSGGTPSRDNRNYWNSKDIPWLKTGEISNRVLVKSEEYISFEGCQNSSAKKLPINTVLIAMYGEGKTKGQSGYLRFEATTNQACCAMICNNEFDSTFLYYFLRINQSEIASLANGGAQPNLSKELIENIKLIRPVSSDISKHSFVKLINHSEILERENQKLSELKDLLLSKLATIEN